jgi:preprotein translocase subunit YajC
VQASINWQELAPPVALMAAMAIMFWFMVARPAKARQQQHQRIIKELKAGDEVVTVGGVHGRISRVRENSVDLEVAPNVRLTLDRRAIRRRLEDKDRL